MNGTGQTPRPMQPSIAIDMKDTQPVECEGCKSELFIPGFKLRKVPSVVSPTGKVELLQTQVWICVQCGAVLGRIS